MYEESRIFSKVRVFVLILGMDRSRKRGRPAKRDNVSRNLSARRIVRHDGYLSEMDNVRRRAEQGNNLNSFRQSTDNFIEK